MPDRAPGQSIADFLANYPLFPVWRSWWEGRSPELREADGHELWRARIALGLLDNPYRWHEPAEAEKLRLASGEKEPLQLANGGLAYEIIDALLLAFPAKDSVDFLLEAAESSLALVPASEHTRPVVESPGYYVADREPAVRSFTFKGWLQLAQLQSALPGTAWTRAQQAQLWRLLRWVDEPVRPPEAGGPALPEGRLCLRRDRPELALVCEMRAQDIATDDDLLDLLLGAGADDHWHEERGSFRQLAQATARSSELSPGARAVLQPLAERCRERILSIEYVRGDAATAATVPALQLRSIWGVRHFRAILEMLGDREFERGWMGANDNIAAAASHFIRICFPQPTETFVDFSSAIAGAKLGERRLVETAVFAPQWSEFIEQFTGWGGLTEAIWWIHAHSKGEDWSVDVAVRELWRADLSRRTALEATALTDGAVDVAWFHRTRRELGAARWDVLIEAAKYGSSGLGHTRAVLFAKAMLGEVTEAQLLERLKKRHQDSVRALGLLPLPKGARRDPAVLARYRTLQEFARTSKQFGSQRQANEKRAVQIGLENLARTAGYADPIRLEWAMEAESVSDLAGGPLHVAVGDVTVSLGIDAWGEIQLEARKAGRTLADIPAALKKQPDVASLRHRKAELRQQAARIRPALEQLMVRGETFSAPELRDLLRHPLLAPMLSNLVLVGEGIIGYPTDEGRTLTDASGRVEALKASERVRLAHPLDLLPAASWQQWQAECLAHERIQPFKQVFRELYVLTDAERESRHETHRYAGQQVQPRQSQALLGQRGWVSHTYEGVRKTYHEAGITAWLEGEFHFYTPAEVEPPVLGGVHFSRRSDGQGIALADLPPRLFSEAMRDLDLVVSVAHAGGIDPEASASTVEMRSALVRETCRLLGLSNVEVRDRYAFITGQMGDYSVHLGSALARRLPGSALLIVAVPSQQRGRLFLPFADHDPKTAEAVSKVLLLARDHEIKDPAILDQIR